LDVGQKEPSWRLCEDEEQFAAGDEVIVVVFAVAVIDGFLALEAAAILCGELGQIDLGAELCRVADGVVTLERQSCHAGNSRWIVGLQRCAKFREEVIEFLLYGDGRGRLFRLLGQGVNKGSEKSCEDDSR
jgi:hypothetical protein